MTCTAEQAARPPLTRRDLAEIQAQIPEWQLLDGRLVRRFETSDFIASLALVNDIARIANEQGHFPDIRITEYRYVDIIWYTYRSGGLTRNDVIMAARVSALTRERDLEASP